MPMPKADLSLPSLLFFVCPLIMHLFIVFQLNVPYFIKFNKHNLNLNLSLWSENLEKDNLNYFFYNNYVFSPENLGFCERLRLSIYAHKGLTFCRKTNFYPEKLFVSPKNKFL
jgi:hypothetical protein